MFPPRQNGEVKPDAQGRFGTMIEDARQDALAEIEPGEESRAFYNLSVPKKLTIMFGGPLMNLLLAAALFTAVFSGFGMPTAVPTISETTACVPSNANPNGISSVDGSCGDGEKTPASVIGLAAGDVITQIDGLAIVEWEDISKALAGKIGKEVDITFTHNGKSVTKTAAIAELNYTDENGNAATRGFIGISPSISWVQESPTVVPNVMASMMRQTFTGLFEMPQMVAKTGLDMIRGNERDENGPVSVIGVGRISGDIAASGAMDTRAKAATLVELLASVNLLLFVFNMVPLLPLDGGHIAGALYEGLRRQVARIRGKKVLPGPADTAKLLPVAYVVSMFLVLMSVVIIAADIFNPLNFG
jgi:membrane-associated protease RseP (regulator of RpoE activity)